MVSKHPNISTLILTLTFNPNSDPYPNPNLPDLDVCMISHFHDGAPYMQHTAHATSTHATLQAHTSYSDAARMRWRSAS